MYIRHTFRTGAMQVHKFANFKKRGVLSKIIYRANFCTFSTSWHCTPYFRNVNVHGLP